MTPYVVEKNWWVVQTLSIIYPSIIESSGDIKLRIEVGSDLLESYLALNLFHL